MGLKGKLIASMEVTCEEQMIYDLLLTNGQEKIIKYVIEAIDPHKKSINRKLIKGNLLELYNSFTIVSSCEHQWITWALEYKKKTEDTPEPLIPLGFLLDVTKDLDADLLKK
ncbi:kirola-like [Lycium barbarum]|uniref:kirola-like n=1 Tax=Lycium barbarum TaxID=112863 RepID=UPI00293E85B1|nr:kirola-like [Lycium barbarum]